MIVNGALQKNVRTINVRISKLRIIFHVKNWSLPVLSQQAEHALNNLHHVKNIQSKLPVLKPLQVKHVNGYQVENVSNISLVIVYHLKQILNANRYLNIVHQTPFHVFHSRNVKILQMQVVLLDQMDPVCCISHQTMQVLKPASHFKVAHQLIYLPIKIVKQLILYVHQMVQLV